MSLSATFPNDLPLSSLELFDPSVVRTIYSPFILPWTLEELYPQYDFFTSHNFNTIIDKVYDNLDYLRGFSTLYNTVLPLDSMVCSEYDQVDKTGIYVDGEYEVTFTPTTLMIYKLGVLYQQITETSFGKFVNIKSVTIVDDHIYIIDGLYLLKLDISSPLAEFITFFGGYGGSEASYKFALPLRITFDETTQKFYIFDKTNKVIKIYTKELSYEKSLAIGASLGVDVVGGIIYTLTETEYVEVDSGVAFDHSVSSPKGIVVDSSQSGFLWIYNNTQIMKYTTGGLHVGTYEMTRISDVNRYGTKLFVIDYSDDDPEVPLHEVVVNLDYSYTQTISTSNEHKFGLSAAYLHPDELASDWVINDTMFKVYDNLNDFNLSLTGRFVANLDTSSKLGSITTEPVDIEGVDIDCEYFQTQDEIVSCSSLNRPIIQIYSLMEETRVRLIGLDVIDEEDGGSSTALCWSLGAQSCEGVKPQLFNTNFTPLSFVELSNPIFDCDPLTGACCLSSDFVT